MAIDASELQKKQSDRAHEKPAEKGAEKAAEKAAEKGGDFRDAVLAETYFKPAKPASKAHAADSGAQAKPSAEGILPALQIAETKGTDAANATKDNTARVGEAAVVVDRSFDLIRQTGHENPQTISAEVLNRLADDPDFFRRATAGTTYLNRVSLQLALMLDAQARDPKSAKESGLHHLFSGDERDAVARLFDAFGHIGEPSSPREGLAPFADGPLSTTLGDAAARAGAKPGELAGRSTKDDAVAAAAGAAMEAAIRGMLGKLAKDGCKVSDASEAGKQADGKGENKSLEAKAEGKLACGVATATPDVPALTPAAFKDMALKVYDRIDKDGNGHLGTDELARAVQSDEFKGQEAQAVAALYHNRGNLEELSNDEWGDENDGPTKKDLEKFAEIEKQRSEALDIAFKAKTWTDNNFGRVDANGDGFISGAELDTELGRKDLSDDDRKVVQHLKDKISDIEEMSNDEWGDENDGITKADIAAHLNHLNCETDEAKLVSGIVGRLYTTAESQKGDVCHDLYKDKENPISSIKPDAIKQGSIGDCYFVASLAALAATNPETIARMIKDNKDGTYTVTFAGAPNEPITVSAPSEAEMGLYNGGSKHGTWACVMEKAYGQYCNQHFWRRSPFNLGGGNTPHEGADGGGRTSGVMSLLTGKSTDCDTMMVTSESTTAQKLSEAFSSNPPRSVTCGINKDVRGIIWKGYGNTSDGFPNGHAYSVVGFEPDGKGGGTVIVRNPWGGQDGTTSGTMRVSLKDFTKNFSDVTYQSR